MSDGEKGQHVGLVLARVVISLRDLQVPHVKMDSAQSFPRWLLSDTLEGPNIPTAAKM